MARIKIETELGDEVLSLPYTTRIEQGGEEIILIDENGFGILQGGLPGEKGPVGDAGPDGAPGEDYVSMLGVADGICPLGPDSKVPDEYLPAAPSGGSAPAATMVYNTARMLLAPTQNVAINGIVNWNHANNRNDTGFAYSNGVFTAPAVIPETMMVKARYTIVFSATASGFSASILRNGAGFAGNAVRTTSAATEKEFCSPSTVWFKPAPNETISCTVVSSASQVIRGDSSWFELEVRE